MDLAIGVVVGARGDAGAGFWLARRDPDSGLPEGALFSPPATLDQVAASASVVVLALSQEESFGALTTLGRRARKGLAIVSTCPVVSLRAMRSLTGEAPALFRAIVSPGTEPGEGAVALAAEPETPADVSERVKGSLASIGAVEMVSEDALDAVAALVLGGAAFMCAALEGMEEGAVREGLPRETARPFVHQTALATALLLRDHLGSPADLKDQVASPGGTTIAALASLEDAGVRGAFLRAVQRSAVKVRERRDRVPPIVLE
jgi:pyrroline-5-carboxylate reductase